MTGEQNGFRRAATSTPLSALRVRPGQSAGEQIAFRRAAVGLPVSALTVASLIPAAVSGPPVAGYYDWWDATDATKFTTTGSAVNTWTSKGSQATVLTVSGTGVTTGTRTLNSLNVVDFDSNGSFTATGFAAQPNTIFFVFKRDATGVVALLDYAGGGRNLLSFSGTEYDMFAGSAEIKGGTLDLNPHVIAAVFNGASSTAHVDGVATISGNPGTQNLSDFRIGQQQSAAQLDGYIAEIITYASALSAGNRQSVEAYLKARWGTP